MTSAATGALPGGTPILDREAPLPSRAGPGLGMAVVYKFWLGAALLVSACWILDRPPSLREWFQTDFRPWLQNQWTGWGVVGFGLSALAAFYLMLGLHELGHVAAGLCVRFRCRSWRVGPFLCNFRPFQVSLYRGPGAVFSGIAELSPGATDMLARRGMVMVLGGPLANFLSALVVLLLPIPMNVFSGLFIACSLANVVSDLLPYESRLGALDGRRLWMLWRQPARGERWLALLHLSDQLMDGVLPEALSADFMAKAVAVQDASADTVKSYAIAYSEAFHQHKDREAGQRLETCLAYSGHAAPALREALKSDAAVYQARRRKRGDLADQWLAEIPVTTPFAWFRSRAEAAILEAKGDVEGALNKLAETETAIRALPQTPQRETLLLLLSRWKSDLCRS